MGNTTLKVKHSANSGDVIYTQWTCKEIFLKFGTKVDYYQWVGRPGIYYDGAVHPVKDEHGNMVTMNDYMFDMLKPLIEMLPWINSFNKYTGRETIDIDLDEIRDRHVNMPYGDIRKWYGYVFADVQVDIADAIVPFPLGNTIFKTPEVLGKIIVNRSERYRNEQIDYGFLSKFENIWFAGTLGEYDDMKEWIPNIQHLVVKDFLELASEIYHSRFFIGNQSFCYSLAEAFKIPRALEVCSYAPNVIVCGPNGKDFLSQAAFKIVVEQLYELTK
jgi:hypothetical protein